MPGRYQSHRRRSAKSFVDDLDLSRGVVLSRAVASLRSIETKPSDSEICPHQTDTFPKESFNSIGSRREANFFSAQMNMITTSCWTWSFFLVPNEYHYYK